MRADAPDELEVEQVERDMPVVRYLGNREATPFAGYKCLKVLHTLQDLIPYLKSCQELGLKPRNVYLFYKQYPYPSKDGIISYLSDNGYNVQSLEDLDTVLAELNQRWHDESVLVVEDGGYIVPKLCTKYENLGQQVVGAVEQTTKGEREDEQIESDGKLLFPVTSVAGSEIKGNFETPYVAKATTHAIQDLVDENLHGRNALVIGYGTVGSKVAERLQTDHHMSVKVAESELTRRVNASSEGFSPVQNPSEAVEDKSVILGTTGTQSIGREALLNMDHGTYVISSSSDQKEVDLEELNALSRSREELVSVQGDTIGTRHTIPSGMGADKVINLVADGYPINFWERESLPTAVSDTIMAFILAAAIDMARNHGQYQCEVNAERVDDEIIKRMDIADLLESLHSN
jgi:S-adenosylhomocysteine hydrolase